MCTFLNILYVFSQISTIEYKQILMKNSVGNDVMQVYKLGGVMYVNK